ncbi:FG-GAP repeat domain-containing protein [Pseudoalteromonas denitrificans]|uniref:Repeat domain-containing protein n=1 Tax=Pseudoalteromonas denitrificans DSM 6059 TaxID=1123010 RepID=A0A1I1PJA3_9GAMM|nr:VCBS repeat-containing protein [Pseudoalteromonas denitrificans]SFD09796.1 Repeat domain-containing protein [Pseudoalteromonas denitrificans DSM 6059]
MHHFRKNILIYSMVLASSLSSSHVLAANKQSNSKKIDFKEITIEAPYKLIQPVMAADLKQGNAKELILLGVDNNKNKWLVIYQYNEVKSNYVVLNKIQIPKQFYSFDLSEYKKEHLQNLYFLSSSHIAKYNIHKNQFETITQINSIFLKENPEHINRAHFIKDFNKDNLDDFIMSDFSNTQIFIGQSNNTFIAQSLPIPADINLHKDGATYKQAKLYFEDINFDNKIDIIKVGEGKMQTFNQVENGQFNLISNEIHIDKSISGTEWWNKKDETGENLDQTELEYRKLEELRDINFDGITDMVVRFTKVSGVLDRVNDYEVYLGTNSNDQLIYDNKPNSVIHAEGTLTGLEFIDIDNDKKPEVMLAGFDIGLSQIIGALIAGSIDQDVYLFKMDKHDNYLKKPHVNKEVELNFSLSSGQSGSAVVKLADLDADGLKDLILSDGEDELDIYFGQSGKKLFSRRAVEFDTQLPKDGNSVSVSDLNDDGKDDLLLKFSKSDDNSNGHDFKILLTQ